MPGGYASIWQDMQGYTGICQDMSGYAKRRCEEHHAGNLQVWSLGHPKRKKIRPRSISKCVEKSYGKSMILVPRGSRNRSKWRGTKRGGGRGTKRGRGTKARRVLFGKTLAPLGRFWMIFGTPRNRTGCQKRSKKINTATF